MIIYIATECQDPVPVFFYQTDDTLFYPLSFNDRCPGPGIRLSFCNFLLRNIIGLKGAYPRSCHGLFCKRPVRAYFISSIVIYIHRLILTYPLHVSGLLRSSAAGPSLMTAHIIPYAICQGMNITLWKKLYSNVQKQEKPPGT